jgi:hypothetical protein
VADETDFNAQVEQTLTHVTRIILLTLKTPLLIVDLFRNSTLNSMISEGGAERRYLGPQSLLVVAFLLRVCEDYAPNRFKIFEPKLLMPEALQQEKFHYLLEFFLWFAIFSLVRALVVYFSGLTRQEKKFFEQILGYATAVPLVLVISSKLVGTLLVYFGLEKASGGGYYPNVEWFQLAIIGLALLCVTVLYPFALLYRASRRVVTLDPKGSSRKHPSRWVYWWAGSGTVAVMGSQLLFAWSPDFIHRMLPPPVAVEIMDMYLTSKPASATTFPVAMSLKVTNRSNEDVFVDLNGLTLFDQRYGPTPVAEPSPHKQFTKIGKESSEVILVERSVEAPTKANLWIVNLPLTPASSNLLIHNAEPFLFWPPADDCFGDRPTHSCPAKIDKH